MIGGINRPTTPTPLFKHLTCTSTTYKTKTPVRQRCLNRKKKDKRHEITTQPTDFPLTTKTHKHTTMSPFSLIFLSICLLFTSTLASPTPHPPWAHKPAYFLLAGDSTTATQSANGGGWGDGFLNHTLAYPSSGKNYGHNGATTKSFREGGDWGRLIGEAKMKIREGWDVFVTVQVSLFSGRRKGGDRGGGGGLLMRTRKGICC